MSNELALLKHAFYHLIFMYYIVIYSVFFKKTQAVPDIHYTYLLFTNVSRYSSLMLPQGLMSKGGGYVYNNSEYMFICHEFYTS